MCVCELQGALQIAQPSVSKHLKLLGEAGLVDYKKEGLWVNYYLAEAYLKTGNRAKAIERLKSAINYTGGPHITAEIYRRRAEEQLSILEAEN